jgi:hypothetical protein
MGDLAEWSDDEDPFPYVLYSPTTVIADRLLGWRRAPERLFAFDGRRFYWRSCSEDDPQIIRGDAACIVSLEYGTSAGYSWLRIRRDTQPDSVIFEFDNASIGPVEELIRELRGLLTGVLPTASSAISSRAWVQESEHMRFRNAFRVMSPVGDAAEYRLFEPALTSRSLGIFSRTAEPAHALFVTETELVAVSDLNGHSTDHGLIRTFVPRSRITEADVETVRAGRTERCVLRLGVRGNPVIEMGFSLHHLEALQILVARLAGGRADPPAPRNQEAE